MNSNGRIYFERLMLSTKEELIARFSHVLQDQMELYADWEMTGLSKREICAQAVAYWLGVPRDHFLVKEAIS